MKLVTIDPLVLEVSGSRIVVSSPLLRKRLRVGKKVADLLLAAQSGLEADGSDPVVARLVEAGFLVEPPSAPQDLPEPWRHWGIAAWQFHQRTRDTPFVVTDRAKIGDYLAKVTAEPAPPNSRPPVSDRILLLPRVRHALEVGFREVLERRRTHRDFTDEEIPLDALSDLLHYTFAPLRFADAGEMGVLQLRAAASAGARHETEAFVGVFKVTGVQPGLYHYDSIRHGLVPLPNHADRETFEHLTHGQGLYRQAAFGVLTVAVARRMSWKYRNAVSYKVMLQNVGHVAQVFSMTATALGLGAAMTGALRNTDADTLLDLDQPREFVTFALACGRPILGPGGTPRAVRTAGRPS